MSILHLNNTTKQNSPIAVDQNTVDALQLVAEQFAGRALLETTFSLEDQVLTHLIFENNIPIRVFTRSGSGHYDILKETIDHYGKPLEVSFHQGELSTKNFAANNPEQVDAWEARPEIAPLSYILASRHIVLSTKRNEQTGSAPLKWNQQQDKFVFSPLIYWTDNQIYAFILENNIPHIPASVPAAIQSELLSERNTAWSGSFKKFLPQHSLVSGSFNIVHQIAAFFRLPEFGTVPVLRATH